MAIPDFQSLMLPFLRVLGDGVPRKASEVIAALAREFNVSDEELKEQLPSGRAPKFANRVHWARMFLKAAGLVENPARGVFRITERGKQELRLLPSRIDIRYLHKYPEFAEWRRRASQSADADVAAESATPVLTPQEQMEQAHQHLASALADELLERVRACEPAFFEELVVQLLLKMGYGGSRTEAGRVVGRSGDGGIDGVIAEDRLGLDAIYVQAKKWDAAIGASQIRDFLGAMVTKGANKGVFITTSRFAPAARSAAGASPQHKLVLIDGERLAELMIEHGLGVTTVAIYEVRRVDSDFFASE